MAIHETPRNIGQARMASEAGKIARKVMRGEIDPIAEQRTVNRTAFQKGFPQNVFQAIYRRELRKQILESR